MATTGDALLRDRLGVLRRRKGTIALVTGALVGLTLLASLLQTKVYASTARLLLQPRTTESLFDPSAGLRLDPGRAVRNEIEVLKSEPVREAVRAAIGSAPAVTVTTAGDTDVINVTAEDPDPDRAARVANAYAEAYIAFRQRQSLDDLEEAGREVQGKVDDLQRQIEALDRQVVDAPPAQADAVRESLSQQRQALVSTQALFKQRLDQIQVEAPLKSGGAQVVAQAQPGREPVSPQPVRNTVLALVLGLAGGVGLAFVRDHLDDSIKSKDDLEQATRGLPVVGLLPLVTASRTRDDASSLVTLAEPSSPAAEAYRTLRTSVQFLSLDRTVRSLMITSPNAGEGKTTTIANLGVVFARAGVPVVIVSCDLRRPRIHELFGLPNRVGFTSVLLGDAPMDAAVQPVPDVKGLLVLPSGPVPPNPSELLALRRTTEVLTILARNGTMVLIDSPPVLPVTDALVLAHKVDAMVLVGVAGITAGHDAARAVELLDQVNAPLVGTVLNGVTSEGGYGYSYGYYAAERPTPPFRPRRAGGRREAAKR